MGEQFKNGYALLIGVNESQAKGWELPDVRKDVEALAAVLTHPERCAYPAENVKVMLGAEASRDGILKGLDWLGERLQADASENQTAVIYYSGHGWRDQASPPNYYLIPYDIQASSPELTALPANGFARKVEALQPRRLMVVMDACHSGGMGVKDPLAGGALPEGFSATAPPEALMGTLLGGSGAGGAAGISKGLLQTLAKGSGRAVLYSSKGEQLSYIRPDRKMSVFTYHLIEALTGHAPALEGAKAVQALEVMGYVSTQVEESARKLNGEQTPAFKYDGDQFPIALVLGGKGLSKGAPAPDPLEALPSVDTGGGAYTGGDVTVDAGGVFTGRDLNVGGDFVMGDRVGGDKITIGNISGTGIAIGRGSSVSVQQGLGEQELASLFAAIYPRIEALTVDPIDKDDIKDKVERIQQEASRPDGNPERVRRWLGELKGFAPEILRLTVEALTKAPGVIQAIKDIAGLF